METTVPVPPDHPESPEAIRQQLHTWIEEFSDELRAALHAVLRVSLEAAAPPPPAARGWQDSTPPCPSTA